MTLAAPPLRRAASSAGVGTAVLLAVAPASASAASERFRCDSLTAEGHEATDFLNGLPGAAARTSEPAGRARQPGEVPDGIQLVALPITAPVRGGPAQQQHIAQADTDQDPDQHPAREPHQLLFPLVSLGATAVPPADQEGLRPPRQLLGGAAARADRPVPRGHVRPAEKLEFTTFDAKDFRQQLEDELCRRGGCRVPGQRGAWSSTSTQYPVAETAPFGGDRR